MSSRGTRLGVLLVVGLLAVVGAGVVADSGGATATTDGTLVQECAATPTEDFADPDGGNDVVGWVDGYWYDEPLDIDTGDGITEAELEALSARTAARFETLRCLTFEEVPPVEILTREEFVEETAETFEGVDDRSRLFDNAMLETLLLVGSDEDSVEVREEDRTVTVGGYYDFTENRIVVVSDDPNALAIDEAVLAHELGHALQDQHFDLSQYARNTTDLDKATLGMIEGDTNRIEHQYQERCDDDRWSEPCLVDEGEQSADGDGDGDGGTTGGPSSWGLYFMDFQPYSDGPSFVEHVYQDGGWEAVDAVYDEMPQTTLHTIYPETYGDVELDLEDLAVEDRSGDNWERVTIEEGPDYDVIGQAGLSSILIDPAYDGQPIVSPEVFLNMAGGELHPTNPINYDLTETDGWRGDRLYVYHDDENRTGTVWTLDWTNGEEATEFADAYEQLIDVRGGERIDGDGDGGGSNAHAYDDATTYEFGDDSDFEMGLQLVRDDDRLWIVTAPTVDELRAVHDLGVDVELDGEEVGEIDAGDDETDDPDDADEETPGFGIVASIVVLIVGSKAIVRKWYY